MRAHTVLIHITNPFRIFESVSPLQFANLNYISMSYIYLYIYILIYYAIIVEYISRA